MLVRLVVIHGPDLGREFPLVSGGTLTVGRSLVTDTRLRDGTVSRLHCQLEFDGRQTLLLNVSERGTKVNGVEVTQHQLKHGDVIRIGGTELRFIDNDLNEAETLLQASPLPSS